MKETAKAAAGSEFVTIEASPAQIEQLAALGVLSREQLAAGRQAGSLLVELPARVVADWQARQDQIEELAQRLHRAGLSRAARLFLSAGRPLTFLGSQLLLTAQPAAQLFFGSGAGAERYSRLLEDRANVDRLLTRLTELENSPRKEPKA